MYPVGIFFIIEGFNMRLNKISLAAFVLGGSVLLAACGGGNDSPLRPVSTVTTPTTANFTASTGAAVMGGVLAASAEPKSFSFASGVPAFGTTGPTTMAVSGTGAAPTFGISSAEGSASGGMTFASCHFLITTSTYPSTHALGQGKTVVVDPCSISIDTAGKTADGGTASTGVSFVLGTTTSAPVSLPVAISSTGVVSVGGVTVGTATVVVTTGAGG
jgi:hypothetical protein